ncbi:unnamed protein product [Schistosoma intercalatum]|nr:unnamed protein product [Schistosoma intercalatum]
MERFSKLVLLNSQPSSLFQGNNLLHLLHDVQTSENLEYFQARDVILCVGNAISSCPDNALQQKDLLLSISELLFKRSSNFKESSSETLLKKVLDGIFVPLAKLSKSTACDVVQKFLVRMLEIVLNDSSDLVGRFDVLTSLNSMLSGIPSTKRNCLWNDRSLRSAISNFGAGLRDLGDFDLQAHSSALLLRLVPREIQRQFASTYIIREFPTIAQEFSNIGGVNFEFEVRSFLNTINGVKNVDPKIISLPCEALKLCDLSLRYPETPNVKGDVFWLDFNLGTNRITSYCLAPLNQASQISDCTSQSSYTWEILTIYPELLDCLDIKLETGVIVVRFTMTEPIKDVCEWAKSVSGYVIEARIIVSALSKNFFQLKFTSSTVVDDSEEANLVSILKRLQSLRQYFDFETFETTTHLKSQPLVSNNYFGSIATSPVNVDSTKRESCTQSKPLPKLMEMCTPKLLNKSSTSYQSSIACSPIVYNSKFYSVVTNDEDSQIHLSNKKDEALPGDGVSCDPTEVIVTPVTSVHKSDSSTEKFETTEPYSRNLSDEEVHEKSLHDNFTVNNRALDVDLDKSTPEIPRKVLMDTSPVICLDMLEPQIKVDLNEFDVKTPENIRLNYVEANVSTNVFEEFVDNLSSVSSFKVIYKLTELDTSVKQLAKITNEPQVLTENFDSNILKIPNLAKSPKSNSDPIIVISGKQNDSNLRTREPEVPEPDTSLSLSSLVGDDSPIHNVLPTSSCLKLVTSKPKCKSSLLTGRSFCASANQSLSISTKKLCNISASYLLDISPEGVRCPLTPEEYTVVSLPKLSTQVTLKGKTRRGSKQLTTKRKMDNQIKDQILHEVDKSSSSPKTIFTSSLESNDSSDVDYQPLRVRLDSFNSSERRRSARLLNKSQNNLETVTKLDMNSSQLKNDILSSNLSQTSLSSISHTLTETPINIHKIIKPVSTFKKKKFFATTRSERFEKEKQRFQKACEISNVNKKTLKSKKNYVKNENQKKLKVTDNDQTHQRSKKFTSNHFPTMKEAAQTAILPHSMPVDSDQDFNVEIVDPDDERVDSNDDDIISRSWKPAKLSGKLRRLCTKPCDKKSSLVLLSPHFEFEKNGSNNYSPQLSDTSSAASLFAMTPPKHFETGKRTKVIPLTILTSISQANKENFKSTSEKHILEENPGDKNLSVFNIIELESDKPNALNGECNGTTEQFNRNSFDQSPLPVNLHNKSSKELEVCSPMNFENFLQHVTLISTKVEENILAHQELEQRWISLQKELSDLKLNIQVTVNKDT